MEKENDYTFWIDTPDGQEIQWRRLTKRQAEAMHKLTEDGIVWAGVRAFGWAKQSEKGAWYEKQARA